MSEVVTDYWIRVNLGVELHVKKALLDILHNFHNDGSYDGLPKDPQQLYIQMQQFKSTMSGCLSPRVLNTDQWDKICPPNENSVLSDKWDITIIIVVIINWTNLLAPVGGWRQKMPQPNDNSKAAFVLRARELRNTTKHGSLQDVETLAEFQTLWTKMKAILMGLTYDRGKMEDFDKLKTGSLKMLKWKDMLVKLKNTFTEFVKMENGILLELYKLSYSAGYIVFYEYSELYTKPLLGLFLFGYLQQRCTYLFNNNYSITI